MDCSFCGSKIPEGSEVIFVTRKGKVLYFCRSKCEKNMIKLGRKPRKVKWTKEYAVEKEARLRLGTGYKPKEEKKEVLGGEATVGEKPAVKEKKAETPAKKESKPAKKAKKTKEK